MRLGAVARADNSGLGVQTWEFVRHMKPAKTMVVDISKLNGNKNYFERYPEAQIVRGIPTPNDIDEFLRDLDVVFLAEAPYNFYLYARAKELGVKVADQYNFEFFDWFSYPHYPTPDMLIAPSRWRYNEVEAFAKERGIEHIYLHCPVDRDRLPFKARKEAKVFIHLAGRSAAYDRNGTETVIDAARISHSGAKILIKFQGEQGLAHQATSTIEDYRLRATGIPPEKLEITISEAENYWDNYAEGDVMLLPRRYGGNCLPLNEALSVGMPVLMTDIEPNNTWLPPDWLIPAEKIGEFTPRTKVDIYGANPARLADKIDSMFENGIEADSEIANVLANQISWETCEPRYRKALEGLCNPS